MTDESGAPSIHVGAEQGEGSNPSNNFGRQQSPPPQQPRRPKQPIRTPDDGPHSHTSLHEEATAVNEGGRDKIDNATTTAVTTATATTATAAASAPVPLSSSSSSGPLAFDLYSHSLLSQSPGKYFDFTVPAETSSPPRRVLVRGRSCFSEGRQQQQQQQQQGDYRGEAAEQEGGEGGGEAVAGGGGLSQSAGADTYCSRSSAPAPYGARIGSSGRGGGGGPRSYNSAEVDPRYVSAAGRVGVGAAVESYPPKRQPQHPQQQQPPQATSTVSYGMGNEGSRLPPQPPPPGALPAPTAPRTSSTSRGGGSGGGTSSPQQQQLPGHGTPQTSNLTLLLERQRRRESGEDDITEEEDENDGSEEQRNSLSHPSLLASSMPMSMPVGGLASTPVDRITGAPSAMELAIAASAALPPSSDKDENDTPPHTAAHQQPQQLLSQDEQQHHPRDKDRSPAPGRSLLTRQPHTYSPTGSNQYGQPRYHPYDPADILRYARPVMAASEGGTSAAASSPAAAERLIQPPPVALGSSAPPYVSTTTTSSSNPSNPVVVGPLIPRRRDVRPGEGTSAAVHLAPSIVAAGGAGSSYLVPATASAASAAAVTIAAGGRRSSAGDFAGGMMSGEAAADARLRRTQEGVAHRARRAYSVDPTCMGEDEVRRCVSNKELRHVMPPCPLSSSPYTHMLYQKEKLEVTFQKRLMAARESSMLNVANAPSSSTNGDDSTNSSRDSSAHAQNRSSSGSSRRMTNETRKCRRAEHNRAIINDLCEIVADLFIAESRLLNPPASSAESGAHHQAPCLTEGAPDRNAVLATVSGFLSDLPVRYAFGVDAPSEVLVHMRLMAAARADSTKAAVHIANVDGRDMHATTNQNRVASGRTMRLVTISCADCDGLLEYITKLLGTGGSRVVDADVMLTSDNVVLDRFVVEMKGILRLDKLQQYIESYLKESRKKEEDKEATDSIHSKSAQSSRPKSAVSAPTLCRLGSQESIRAGSAYGPLYFHPPKEYHDSPQEKLEQEIQSAVPLSEVISSTSPGNVRSQNPGGQFFRQQQAAPPQLPSRLAVQENASALRVPADTNEDSSSSPKGQATGESRNEAPPSPPRSLHEAVEDTDDRRHRQMLVNREAADFGIGPEHGNLALPEEAVANEEAQALAARPHRVVPVIPFDELMLIETLGSGRVSTIYRAAWQNTPGATGHPLGSSGTSVAMVALKVATTDPATGDATNIEELRREADIAAMLDHNNICSLVGVASDPECFCLAYDFCEGGSLLSLVSDTSRCYEYLPIALDIANGMAYLHSRNVIHRDLKPSNVLLTKDNRAKIADFGMSVANTGQELTAETGTYRWMAPEVIRHESYSSNADVYSFGIVLWQLITREVPFATMTPVQTAYAVAEGHRPEIPPSTPEHLRRIICACWDEDSQKRPSFTYIAMALADYAKMAFNPANVGAQTVQIANETLQGVQGNSTVNVDFSTPVSIGSDPRKQFSLTNIQARSESGPRGGNWFFQPSHDPASSFNSGGNVGLEI